MDRGNLTTEPVSLRFLFSWVEAGRACSPPRRKLSLLLLLTTRVWSFDRCVQTHEVFLKDSAGQTSECYSISPRLGSIGAGSTDVDDMNNR